MGSRITLTASDDFTLNAYRAEPAGVPRGGVVLLGEIWGLNHWVREVADRWAAHGYLCIAPALFDRVEFGYERDDYAMEPPNAIFKTYKHETALLDIAAAVAAASAGGKVGVTGYCFGGANTWRAAAQLGGITAASGYYGGGVPKYLDLSPRVPTEMHFGSRDDGIPLEQVEALKRAHPEVAIYTYDAGHGFCNSDRPNRFDEKACTTASARTLKFFHEHLG